MANDFLSIEQVVTEIVVALFMPINFSGMSTHKNRLSHGLAFSLKGEREYIFDGATSLVVKANDVIYLPKHSSYQVKTRSRGDTYCINFQCQGDEIYKPFVIHLPSANEILKSYQIAEKAWRKKNTGYQSLCKAELYKIIYELQSQNASDYLPKTKQLLIQPAIDYILKHYTKELINIETLSELCGISSDYLRKLFAKFYGCSPIKYVNDLKLKRAKELLASGIYSVSETAQLSGFSDLSHFSRFFKDNVGVLPRDYLK